MIETLRKRDDTSFLDLTPEQRLKFAKAHYGFLQRVVVKLKAKGTPKSLPTVSRTWHGEFRSPNPDVVRELGAEYHYLNRQPTATA